METKERLHYIDKCSGIAITLVVYAHILFPETRQMDWYIKSATFIYKFHMPLFMCLSGYLAFMSVANKNIRSGRAYVEFQKKKIQKFLPVYVFFSLLALSIDVFYRHVSTKEINTSVYSFFFTPTLGSAVFVWYLYVLMGFYLITPFLINLKSSYKYLLLAFGFLLTNVSLTPVFCFDFFCKFFFFFLLGGLLYQHNESVTRFLNRNGGKIVLLAVLLIVVDFLTNSSIPFQVICLAMIPTVLYVSQRQWPRLISQAFITIGVSSFCIYLFNTTLLNLYYSFYKFLFKSNIGAGFVFSCLLMTILIAVCIRIIFNKVVPRRIYAL